MPQRGRVGLAGMVAEYVILLRPTGNPSDIHTVEFAIV